MRIDPETIAALAGFRSALRRFIAFTEESTREAGVTIQQYQALLAIKAYAHGPMPMRELGAEMLLKSNSAVQLVDRLVLAGLIARTELPGDKRAVGLALTGAGDDLLMMLIPNHLEQLSKRKKQLADLLRQLRRLTPGPE
jgi:DNA-binding MarR family transcriptional regulator